MITIAATHHRGATWLGTRVGNSTQKSKVEVGPVCCPEEAILRAWTYAATTLCAPRAEIRIVVNRRLLEGYLRLGWSPRSLPILRALRNFARTVHGTSIEFIYRSERQR